MSQLDRNQEKVKKLSLLPENKECMDCLNKGTTYVVLDFLTFVCTNCSGIHRSFQHRVKGISMSSFKDDEVEKLKQGGNKVANSIWRATWDEKSVPKPPSNKDEEKKKFITLTYVKKKWYSNKKVFRDTDDLPEPIPINEVIKEPIKIKIDRNVPNSSNASSTVSTSVKSNQIQNQTQGFGDDDEWDAGFESPKKNQVPSVDLFDMNQTSTQNQPKPQEKQSLNIEDLFGSSFKGDSFSQPMQSMDVFSNNIPQGNIVTNPGYTYQQGNFQQPMYQQGYNQQGGFQQPFIQQQYYQPYQQPFPQQQNAFGYQQSYQQPFSQHQNAFGYQAYPSQSSFLNPNPQPFQQQTKNTNIGNQVSNANPFGSSNPFDSPTPTKPNSNKPDPFENLAGLGKASLKQTQPSNPSTSSTSSIKPSNNGFDDFPF